MTSRHFLSFALTAWIALLLCVPLPTAGAATTPTDFIRSVVGQVFHTLQTYPVSGPEENMAKRRSGIKAIIDANFDAEDMSRRALGKYWKEQTPAKQQEFTDLFYWRLYNFYILRVETYSDEKVLYKKELNKGAVASVLTQILSRKYPEFDIEYRVKKKNDEWKIYDVVIEGVSLVANYRSQFGSFLGKKSFDELLRELREKNPEKPLP
ncbi:MAG: MlaC/ttg2D family ABC transporter substrate-binding protein [Thermodesulfobacteriota bacterium]